MSLCRLEDEKKYASINLYDKEKAKRYKINFPDNNVNAYGIMMI